MGEYGRMSVSSNRMMAAGDGGGKPHGLGLLTYEVGEFYDHGNQVFK